MSRTIYCVQFVIRKTATVIKSVREKRIYEFQGQHYQIVKEAFGNINRMRRWESSNDLVQP